MRVCHALVLAALVAACHPHRDAGIAATPPAPAEIRLTPETADTFLNGTTIFVVEDEDGTVLYWRYACLADACATDGHDGRVRTHGTPGNFLGIHRDPAPGEEVRSKDGFRIARWSRTRERGGVRNTWRGIGAWGRFSAFDIGTASVSFHEGSRRDDYAYTEATLTGVASRSDPSRLGGARWTGVMLGKDYGDLHDQRFVRGDAALTVDFDEREVDVAFTGVVRTDGTAAYPDMTWTGLPMRDGRFASTSIEGRFFGNEHQEAAGVFDRDDITGAFGASRQ